MKLLWRIVKWLFIGIVGLILAILVLLLLDRDYRKVSMTEAEAAAIPVRPFIERDSVAHLYDELLAEYGKNKALAPGFELQCLLALRQYPELKETPIAFQMKEVFLPLASRPDPVTILFPWIKRKYLVVISTNSADFFEDILLKNLPFNAQVGIIGHELGHSLYYQDKSALKMAKMAYDYQYNDDYVTPFERDTDKRAIAHGLGYQLYQFAFHARKSFGMSEKEIDEDKGGTYLSPGEIAEEMAKYDFYRDNWALDSIRQIYFPR